MVANPGGLWYLVLLLPVALVIWRRYRSGRSDLVRLAGKWREAAARNTYLVKWFFSSLAIVLFTACGALAISGLSWGRYPVSTNYTGTDVALLVDVSRSMLAEDVYPSRIKRAAGVIREVVRSNPGTRFSLVIFKGRAVEVVPPTEDSESITAVTDVLGPSMFTAPGTDIERGIDAAVHSFPQQDGSKKIVLLFSDGGSLSGDVRTAAREAARQNVSIAVVATGTAAGAQIPLGGGAFVTDSNGNRVVTRLDRHALEAIAQISGGELYSITDPLLTQKLDSLIAGNPGSARAGEYRFEIKNHYRLFLAIGLICLGVFVAARIIRWRGLV